MRTVTIGPQRDSDERGEDCLLQEAGAGDHGAFHELYHRISTPIYSLLLNIARNPATADDWLQQTFIKVWQNAPSFDPAKGRAFSWIAAIARRTALDNLRKAGRESRKVDVLSTDPTLSESTVEDATESADDVARVRAALAELPEDQRLAVESAFLRGMTHEEISRQTDTPLGTVKARIRRGLLKLREHLNAGGAP